LVKKGIKSIFVFALFLNRESALTELSVKASVIPSSFRHFFDLQYIPLTDPVVFFPPSHPGQKNEKIPGIL